MPTIYKPARKKRVYDNSDGRRGERHEIYDTERWRRLRALKFADSPLCEMCLREGRVRAADEIHHVRSFMSVPAGDARYALAFDYDNLMSLCSECHRRVHSGR